VVNNVLKELEINIRINYLKSYDYSINIDNVIAQLISYKYIVFT
jgi:hypothetical protein